MLLDPQDQKNEATLKGETAQDVTRSDDATSPSQSASAAPPSPTSSPHESEVPPPSYYDSAASSSSNVIIDPDALPESLKTAPRSSRVSQYAQNRSVIATHVLDLTYPAIPTTVPPEEWELVDGEEGEGKKSADAFFGSQNGRCHATVAVVGCIDGGASSSSSSSTTPPKRAWIVVQSQNGSAKAEIIHRTPLNQPFSLRTSSVNGSATVLLPRSFHGPVHFSSRLGSVKVSSELQKNYTLISTHPPFGFIGDQSSWDGRSSLGGFDECWATTQNGNVNVKYADEESSSAPSASASEIMAGVGKAASGLLGSVKGWMAGKQE